MTTLTVPLVPPSANALRRKFRHPHSYKKLREVWERSLAYAATNAEERTQLKKQASCFKVRVRVTVTHAGEYDKDNFFAALKPVLDALIRIGYLHDDNSEWMELECEQQTHPRVKKTTVTIEALERVRSSAEVPNEDSGTSGETRRAHAAAR